MSDECVVSEASGSSRCQRVEGEREKSFVKTKLVRESGWLVERVPA